MSSKVAIVGSRKFPDLQRVREVVNDLLPDITVVSGGAKGVDTVAEAAAKGRGLNTIIFPAEWRFGPDRIYNPRAGFERNTLIVKECDSVIAFWDGLSGGTKDTIDKARAMGKPVWVIPPRKENEK